MDLLRAQAGSCCAPARLTVPERHIRRFVLSQTVPRVRRVVHVVIGLQMLTGGCMARVHADAHRRRRRA